MINVKKIFGQFKNITANAGEAGGVHSAVNADAHGATITYFARKWVGNEGECFFNFQTGKIIKK